MLPRILVTESAYDKGQSVFRDATDVAIRTAPEKESDLAATVLDCGARAIVVANRSRLRRKRSRKGVPSLGILISLAYRKKRRQVRSLGWQFG